MKQIPMRRENARRGVTRGTGLPAGHLAIMPQPVLYEGNNCPLFG
jgi:hypothetical protein